MKKPLIERGLFYERVTETEEMKDNYRTTLNDTILLKDRHMKATMSKDGFPRFDLRISYRVGLMEMSQYLACYLVHNGDFDSWDPDWDALPKKLPKATILEYVKEAIQDRGLGFVDGWSDELDFDVTQKLLDYTKGIVLRAYPELAKP